MEADEDWVTGTATITIYGEPVEMEMRVPAKPVKARRMLPIFQMMTNSFVEVGVEAVNARGEEISCKAGCGACCRQAVPLAEIEAYQIAELVENLPEPRRGEIKQRFAEGRKQLGEINWFERMDAFAEMTMSERQELVMEYFHQGIPCPFLENEACSIHSDRPLACREYLVTSPAENCSRPTAKNINLVELLYKPSKTVRFLGCSENIKTVNFVTLIQSLEWAEKFPESVPEKTGGEWMSQFFQSLSHEQKAEDQAATQQEEGR